MDIINKYKQTSVQAKATLWYMICNILQKGISFIVVPIYTRLLTTNEYGQYTVFQSWRDLLIIIVTLNLYCGIFTKAMVDYKDDRDRYTSSMQGLTTVLVLIWLIIYLIRIDFWNNVFDMNTITMLLMFSYFLFSVSFSFWSVKQRVNYKYKTMVAATLAMSLLVPLLSVILLKNTNLRANAVIWGFLIVQSLIGIFFYIIQFIQGRCFFHKEYWLHALKYNIPLIPHYLSLIVLSQVDRIMIKNICGADKAGIYGLAYSVSLLMNILTNAINNSFVPWFYEKLRDKDYLAIKPIVNKLCLLIAILTFVAILVSPEIVLILGTKDYYEAIYIIPAVSISVYITFCYGFYSNIEFYYSKTKFVMFASTIGALSNLILNYIFINKYGYQAAGYTTLISYIVLMLMHYAFMKKICKKEISNICIFDDKYMFGLTALLIAMMFICILLYNHIVIRYLVIITIIIILLIYKKKIISLIKDMK